MKKITDPNRMKTNTAGVISTWASTALACALMLAGVSALAAPPANDSFANATVIPASPPATTTGNNTEATYQLGEPLHSLDVPANQSGTNSVWWVWTPAANETITVDTINSGFDTELAIYTGTSVDALTPVVRSEDGVGLANGWSRASFNAVSGTTYHIAVAGFENISGPIVLNFSNGGTVVTGLVLTVNTTGEGTVTRSPDQATYNTNDLVTLVAIPSGTNTFLGWSGTTESDTNLTNTVTMTESKTVTANFTGNTSTGNCGDRTSMTVSTNGSGRVTPNLNNKTNLVICRTYRLTATPAKDYIFAGWSGVSSNENNPRLVFTMQEGLNITANFVVNPFVPVSGTYNGLFFDSTNVTTDCSGYFTIKVSKNGKFTSRFIRKGKTSVATGTFDSNGHANVNAGKGTNALIVDLQLCGLGNAENVTSTNRITGTVITPEGCTAQLEGDRQIFSPKNQSPLQGKYTFVLPRNATTGPQTNEVVETNSTIVTNIVGTNMVVETNVTFTTNFVVTTNEIVINPGHGYATLNIDKSGKAKISGALADGTKINQNTAVSDEGQIPLFASLYRGTGVLIGWVNVNQSNVFGTVKWIRPPGGLVFPSGIDAEIPIVGSPFDRTRSPLLAITTGVVEIGGNSFDSGFETPLLIPVETSKANTFVGSGGNTNKLSLSVNSSGLVKGRFTSPVTLKTTQLNGVVVQNIDQAWGFFQNTGSRGYFQLSGSDTNVVLIP